MPSHATFRAILSPRWAHFLLSFLFCALTAAHAATPMVTAGEFHTMALMNDGSLWGWGANWGGQLGDDSTVNSAVPKFIGAGYTAVAAGSAHTLALKDGGELWAWGHNGSGQLGDGTYTSSPSPKFIGTGYKAIAAGEASSLAIKNDGSLWEWGTRFGTCITPIAGETTCERTTTPMLIGTGYAAVSAIGSSAIALKEDQGFWAFSTFGTSGIDPILIGTGYAAIATCPGMYCVIKTDGSLWARVSDYEYNSWVWEGDAPLPTHGDDLGEYKFVLIGNGYKSVAAGSRFVVALKSDGSLWTWGSDNSRGELGDGTTLAPQSSSRKQIGSGFAAIAANSYHAVALKNDGGLWTWGSDVRGERGWGNTAHSHSLGNDFTGLALGAAHVLGVRSNGSLWAWGNNDSGQLGDGTTIQSGAPMSIGSGFKAVAAGNSYSVALKTDGSLWTWGSNYWGELGNGTQTPWGTQIPALAPQLIGTDFIAAAAGSAAATAIKSDGSLWRWGLSNVVVTRRPGQLAPDYAYSYATTPEKIGTGFIAVSSSSHSDPWPYHTAHHMALQRDGTLWTWGNNTSGQLGDGTTTSSWTPKPIGTGFVAIAAGMERSIALKSDNTLWAWGKTNLEQLGNVSTTLTLTPSQVGTGYIAIAAGASHVLALKSDGSLWGWGTNDNGQLGAMAATSSTSLGLIGTGYTAMVAGGNHSAVRKSDGSTWIWGSNNSGELGDGVVSFRPTRIFATGFSTTTPTQSARGNCLFNWLEGQYPSVLRPSRPATYISYPYIYRYYSGTGAYVGISYANDHLYYLSPDGALIDYGSTAPHYSNAGCAAP